MIPENKNKVIIASIVIIISLALSALSLIYGVKLGPVSILSVNDLLNKRDDVISAENKLSAQNEKYENMLVKIKKEQTNFDKEKEKYEAISEDTIKIIKEATLEDDYDIEYIWITLGNYARANNLNIVLYEPGSSKENNVSTTDEEKNSTSNSNTSSTSKSTVNSTTTVTSETNKQTSTSYTFDDTETNKNTDSILSIKVYGDYIDLCDFVFEIENDNTLRFKLDNIRMVGTSEGVTAIFDVKNTVVLK